MHRPHFHKLREPTEPGLQQTAPAASLHPTRAAGADPSANTRETPGHAIASQRSAARAREPGTSSNTSNGAVTSATDATRGTHMGADRTAGVASVTPAESFTRRIGVTEVQIEWAHNDPLRPTLADLQRVMLAAERAGDMGRVERYRPVTRAYLVRAQKAQL